MSIDKESFPFVTIILPVRNEASSIRQTLTAVLTQNYPKENTEILVVDGMSSDNTRSVVKEFTKDNQNLYLLDNSGKIVPKGMNRALQAAHGEIIIRVDGHTHIAQNYVQQCVIALQTHDAQNVGGKMTTTSRGKFGEAVAIATSSPFGVGGARFHYSDKEEWVDTVYLGAWPRSVFEQIGLFDEELVRDQDDEFNYRLREQGGKILLCPRIQSVYEVRSRPSALWKQYFQYGYWKVRVLQKHPRQMRPRQFAPPIFTAGLLGTSLLAPFWRSALWLLLMTAGSYLVANLAASFVTAFRASVHSRVSLLLLPLVYIILHLSYGLGFLVGLVRFAGRWRDRQGNTPYLSNPKITTEHG